MGMEWVNKWNRKIYWNEDGTRASESGHGIGPEEFWDEFKIKSWPKFRDSCAFYVPTKWADDVREFIVKVQNELGDRITFRQIKEKWCRLTVYFRATDDEAGTRMYELIQECINNLIEKGIHPPKQEIKSD